MRTNATELPRSAFPRAGAAVANSAAWWLVGMGDFVVLRAAPRMVSQGGGTSAGAARRAGTVWVWQGLLAGVGKSGKPPSSLEPFIAVRSRGAGPRWPGDGR